MNLIFIYITNPSKKEAQKIAKHLLREKLIACANIFPVESIYRWKEKIVQEKEYILIVKTTKDKYKKVKMEVEKIHSYNIPCIIKIPIEANKSYFEWIRNEVE